ncbi:MAG: ComEC/Rec2 family competence protein [Phycisphaerales bacterium]|nr:ComEC/Rec2 family competence protein [Phycisphaerales bacterium]
MIRLVLPFIMGILLYDKLTEKSINYYLPFIALVVATCCCLILGLLSLSKKRYQIAATVAAMISICTLAFTICFYQEQQYKVQSITELKSSSQKILAQVSAIPTLKNKTTKYELCLLKLIDKQTTKTIKGKALVYLYTKNNRLSINFGDTILLPNQWQAIHNAGNPFELDFEKNCARKHIYIQQFLSAEQVFVYGKKNTYSFLEKTHQYCISTIEESIKDSTCKALLKAMLLGDEQDIDPNTRSAYNDTGIIHIISISGAHVAILFAAISFLFQLTRQQKHQWLKFIFSLALIWFYVLLAGASTPALRAAIMFSLLILGNVTKQQHNPLNQLLTTAFILLLLRPMWLFNIGFQLSFVAVLSLIIFYKPLRSLYSSPHRIIQYGIDAIAASIAAEILVAPLVGYYFHSFPPMFILANILAGIAMGFILVMGMILLLVSKIGFLATIVATVIVFVSDIFHRIIGILQAVNFSSFRSIYVSPTVLILLYLFITASTFFVLKKKKIAIWMSFLSLLLIALVHLERSISIHRQEKFIVFNQSKEVHCELIKGNHYSILNGDDSETFATKNAHIAYGASYKNGRDSRKIITLENHSILLLHEEYNLSKAFPIDILIITSWEKPMNITKVIQTFLPKQIVISSNGQAAAWAEQCKRANINLHNTKSQGAFIYP